MRSIRPLETDKVPHPSHKASTRRHRADILPTSMTRAQPKKLGPILATMFVTGNMVGSGLFLLPATLGLIGGISVFTWLLATAGALVIAAVFARLGVIAPWSGGPYAYARATLGRYFGFQTNYIYWISCWVGNVGIALAVTGYATELFPALKAPLLSATTTSGVIWIMVLANIWGPRIVGGLEASAMLIGLAPILAIGLGGWFFFDPHVFAESWNVSGRPAVEAVPASLILVFWAFTGLESAAVAVEVVENPKRNLPIAAVGACGDQDIRAGRRHLDRLHDDAEGGGHPWRLDPGQRRHHQGRRRGRFVPCSVWANRPAWHSGPELHRAGRPDDCGVVRHHVADGRAAIRQADRCFRGLFHGHLRL